MNTTPRPTRHAIVIGGSMAGLLAARVLADHYQRVTILDRDTFPGTPDHRPGVPQAHHAHALLARGQMILEDLLPGLTADLRAAGAGRGSRLAMVSPAGKLPSPDLGGEGTFASRVLLDWHVKRRVLALGNVTLHSGADTTHLNADHHGHVTGVTWRQRGEQPTEHTLTADLILDASGRQSRTPDWLRELGYSKVPEECLNSGMGYTSRLYRKPHGFPAEWDALIVNARPPVNPRLGLILPIEHGAWHVTVGGLAGHHPPTDEAGFLQWARDLPDPSLYEAIRVATPLTPLKAARTPTNRLRHYEQLKRWPRNFLVLGDAVCAFNPIYGQGMTSAAMQALDLRAELRHLQANPDADLERRLRRRIAHTVAAPWAIGKGEDLRWDGVHLSGAPHRDQPWLRTYLNAYLRAARTDPTLSGAFMAVTNLFAPPAYLLSPHLALRVLRGTLTRRDTREEWALSPGALERLRRMHPTGDGATN